MINKKTTKFSLIQSMNKLLSRLLDSRESKKSGFTPKILVGNINVETRKLVRGKRPNMSPQRLKGETFSRYRNRLEHCKQWTSEMKYGGANYTGKIINPHG